nr:probable L-type lectin-domain containing receptor kinase S.7 [Ipomoea trifida]
MHPRKLLLFSLLSIIFHLSSSSSSGEGFSFDFPYFTLRNLTLLGDSYLRNGVVGLTRELGVPSSSSGSVIYNNPIRFFDKDSNTTASFSTKFSFSIDNVNPASFGDGLAFFISPDNQTLGSPGGFLGLVNSSQFTKNKFVAVEFDTRQDLHFNDPDGNHVGLDIESLVSIKTANVMQAGINLKSGDWITVWIDYKNEEKKLEVFLSQSNSKPEIALLTVDIDLCGFLKEFMYVGFSGSTEGSTELHYIESWSFQSSGFKELRPRIHPNNVAVNSVPPLKAPPIPVSDSAGNSYHKRLGLGLGIACPAFFCAVLAVFGWVSVKKWKGMKKTEKGFKADLVTHPRQFSYKELNAATRWFNSSRIIGHGSFGTVYKAFFVDSGNIAAVKRSKHAHESRTEFIAELTIIASLRHKNLVQLQGWCVEKDELLLVYEFMPNGSLDKVLYEESEQGYPLRWPYRYNIAVGLASVLTYLHQECEQQVIHRDIKASNIMLDSGYNARLGDFGLARLLDHDKSPVSTLTAGTMGYLAPEYLQYGTATEKTDVFSYGVVILEVACGRRPIVREGEGEKMANLVDWVWRLHSQGRIIEAADKRLGGEFREEEMKKLLLVGLSCANPDSNERPSMRRVLQILSNEADAVDVPRVKPTLTFSKSLPLSIDDIFSDNEDCRDHGSPIEIKLK